MTNTTRETRYAVIAGPGMHGGGEQVRAYYTTTDRDRALKYAAKATREFQRGMRPYGGSSGGYRVIKCSGDARKGDSVGIANWVDRMIRTEE
jgi:hypothetical protein